MEYIEDAVRLLEIEYEKHVVALAGALKQYRGLGEPHRSVIVERCLRTADKLRELESALNFYRRKIDCTDARLNSS